VPRRTAVEDGDRVAADGGFDADPVAEAGGDPGSAVPADPGDVGLWRCGHTTTLEPYLLVVAVIAAAPAAAKWLVEN
jgi:hypothetical protein